MLHGVDSANLTMLVIAAALAGGVLATRVSTRFGVPALVLFLGVGFVLGSDVTGLVVFDDPELTQLAGVLALVVILFEGGLQTPMRKLRTVLGPSLSLATIGVVVTGVITAGAAYLALDVTVEQALLVGAIVASTDAAAVFAVLRTQPIRSRVVTTLEAESGFNDPMAIFLTVLVLGWVTGDTTPQFLPALLSFAQEMGVGLIGGLAFGWFGRGLLSRVRFDDGFLYALLLTSIALLAYAGTMLAHGSGFLAVYLTGAIITSGELPYRATVLNFQAGFAWLMQIAMFVILGLFAFPGEVLEVAVPGIVLALVLTFIARPIAVALALLPFRIPARETTFVAWAGLRGAVPIVLGTYPLVAGAPGSTEIFNVVVFVVVTSAVLQGSTIPFVARKLGLALPHRSSGVTLELASIRRTNVRMMQFELREESPLVGRRLADLGLTDKHVAVSAIVRGEQHILVPTGATVLEAGDQVFTLVERGSEAAATERFGAGDPDD